MSLLTIAPHKFEISAQAPVNDFCGPPIPFDRRIWDVLVDWSKWKLWMENVKSAEISPNTEPNNKLGRGSTFVLYGISEESTLEILHWAPYRKLVYSVGSPKRRFACCYEIDFASEQNLASILVTGELEVLGFRRVVSILLARRYRKIFAHQCRRLANLIDDDQLLETKSYI